MNAEMTPYDRRAWAEIESWRQKQLTARTRRVVPQEVRDRFSDAGRTTKERFDSLPGAGGFEAVFVRALGRLVDPGSRAATTTETSRLSEGAGWRRLPAGAIPDR
jgi:hypothetical protein